MSEVQIAIIDQENTQIALAVPGVQGPAGAISSGGSANQVFHKVSGTNYDAGWTFIGNANVDAAAAIAGTKISPNFGSQTVATTGVFSHALGSQGAPTITFTGDTNTGIYSPGADQLAISTNGSGRLFVDASGNVGVGISPAANLHVNGTTGLRITGIASKIVSGIYIPTGGILGDINDTFEIRNGGGASSELRLSTRNKLSVFTGGAGDLGGGTEKLTVTSAGLVGIGTSSPAFAVDISAANDTIVRSRTNGNTSAGFIGSTNNGTNNWFFGSRKDATGGSSGTDRFNLLYDTNAYLTVTTAGNVGIGASATSPSQQLHVKTDQAAYTWTRIDNQSSSASAYAGLQLGAFGNTWGLAIGSSAANSNSLTFVTDAGGTNSEKMRLDTSGRLLVGTSTSRVVEDWPGNGTQGLIQIEATNSDAIMSIISAGTADAQRCGTLSLGRHRNATVGAATPTIVQSGDALGAICFAGGDGTDMRTKGASIRCEVDGTPGADDMPGRLVFSVTADGASSPTEAMRIKNSRILNFANTPVYADNAAAKTGGLVDGDVYRKSDGTLMIVYT